MFELSHESKAPQQTRASLDEQGERGKAMMRSFKVAYPGERFNTNLMHNHRHFPKRTSEHGLGHSEAPRSPFQKETSTGLCRNPLDSRHSRRQLHLHMLGHAHATNSPASQPQPRRRSTVRRVPSKSKL